MNPNYTEFKFPQIKAHPWKKVFQTCSTTQHAIEFISQLLQYNPILRPSGLQACAHPFFDELRSPNCTIGADKPLPDCFDFTKEELSVMDANLRKRLTPDWVTSSRRAP